jgi:hypothetical protein
VCLNAIVSLCLVCINTRDSIKQVYRLQNFFPALNCEQHRLEDHNKPRCRNKWNEMRVSPSMYYTIALNFQRLYGMFISRYNSVRTTEHRTDCYPK